MFKNSNIRISELENILSKVLHLELLNIGINAYDTSAYTKSQIESKWKGEISDSINMVEHIQKYLQYEAINITLSDSHKKLLTTNIVEMKHHDGLIQLFDLNEATKQIIAKSFNIKVASLVNIQASNTDVFFLNYNLFNKYYMALVDSSSYFISE